jgi:hypothetical protein
VSTMLAAVLVLGIAGHVHQPECRPPEGDPPPSPEEVIAAARAATTRYEDRSLAIADGYRPIGSDFPAMGEHWVNVGLLFDGRTEAERPEFLSYLIVGGRPRLLGVAYAVPLLSGETAPEWPRGQCGWHDHARSVDEETLLPHGAHAASMGSGSGARLAMLHAWVWLPNPDGVFAADNWAIPYARLGLAPPADAPDAAGKALSLLSGGVQHFEAAFSAAVDPAPHSRRQARRRLEAARREVESFVSRRHGTALGLAEATQLAGVWEATWDALERTVSGEGRDSVHALR